MEQIGDAQGPTRHLVLVGGADAAAGGADGLSPFGLLPGFVQGHMGGQDQRTCGTDPQSLHDRYAARLQHIDLFEQRIQSDDNAVADETFNAIPQDARGDQVQHGLLAADDEGVTGVVATLEADHCRGSLGEQVDDLTLALVSPLRTYDNDVFGHDDIPGSLVGEGRISP